MTSELLTYVALWVAVSFAVAGGWTLVVYVTDWLRPELNRRDVADRREQAGDLVQFPFRPRVVRDAVDECGDTVDASVFPLQRARRSTSDELQIGDRVRTIPGLEDEGSVTGTVAGWFFHPVTDERWVILSGPSNTVSYPPERLEWVSA
jgi:hypothetical protein